MEDEEEVSSAKKSKNDDLKNDESKSDPTNDDSENDDSVLGLASCICSSKMSKETKKLLKIPDSLSENIGWLINERMEALPIQVALPLLSSTLQEMNTCFPKIDKICMLARAVSEKENNAEMEDLEFLQDEYNLIFHDKRVLEKSCSRMSGLEAMRRNMWEASADDGDDQDDDKDQHEKAPALYPYKAFFVVKKKDLEEILNGFVGAVATAVGDN